MQIVPCVKNNLKNQANLAHSLGFNTFFILKIKINYLFKQVIWLSYGDFHNHTFTHEFQYNTSPSILYKSVFSAHTISTALCSSYPAATQPQF